MGEEGIYQKSIRSGKWFLVKTLSQKALGVVSFFILARLLVPEDYGVIAAVMLVIGLANQLTLISFGDALTQRKGDIEPYLDPLWTFELLRCACVAVFLFFAGGMLSEFFHLAGPYAAMMRMSGVLVILPALGNIRQIYFFKELDFEKVFWRDVVAQIAFAVVAVAFAVFVSASPWALFAGYFAQYVAGVGMSYALRPSLPGFSVKFRMLLELLGFSKWTYGQDLLDFVSGQLDRLVVGRMLSVTEFGIYTKAKDLSSTAASTVFSILDKVGFAAYSKVQDRMEKVHEGFLKSIDVILIGALPLTILLLLEGGVIVDVLLGSRWLALVVPLKIFAFGNLFVVFSRIVTPVLSALGRPDINFKINLLQLFVTVPTLTVGYSLFGFSGFSYAIVVTWIVVLCYVIFRARKILHIPVRAFMPAITSGTIAAGGTFALDLMFRLFRQASTGVVTIIIQICVLGVVYFALLLKASSRMPYGPYQTLLSILRTSGVWKRRA